MYIYMCVYMCVYIYIYIRIATFLLFCVHCPCCDFSLKPTQSSGTQLSLTPDRLANDTRHLLSQKNQNFARLSQYTVEYPMKSAFRQYTI